LKPRLDVAEADWHATQPPGTPPPTIIHHPVDTTAQTGDSLLLGGPMSIHAPWSTDEQSSADHP
jgi:hypothetical protein